MCGFVGVIDTVPLPRNRDYRSAMLEAVRQRGPDSAGSWETQDGRVWFGHRRLKVIELSEAGHQPMQSGCGRYVIAFNGEIYNHLAIRSDLEAVRAYPVGGWKGHSDTETLLAAIGQWGLSGALRRTVGMFAFALFDSKFRTVSLARDRIGEKPLYYGWHRTAFLFGSSLQALRAHPSFNAEVDWAVCERFLRLNFSPGPDTIYRSTLKLVPGTFLTLTEADIANRALPEPVAYWSLEEAYSRAGSQPFSGDFESAVETLDELLTVSIKQQAVADVPVGAFLSGGVDSSLVLAKMVQVGSCGPVKSFTIGMPQADLDESVYAARVAEHLGAEHETHVFDAREAQDTIPDIVNVWDEPFGDSSQLPTYILSRLARRRVTVILSGDGGDELFLGYPRYAMYRKLWRTRGLGWLPWELLLRSIPSGPSFRDMGLLRHRAQSVVRAWRQPNAHSLVRYFFDPYRGLETPLRGHDIQPPPFFRSVGDAAEVAALWDTSSYLPDDLLVKLDRASMAHGLEARVPLLDHRIVEFALSLPSHFKLSRGGIGKYVLRAVLDRYVPRHLVDRPKMGFTIPLGNWLRGDLRPWAEEVLGELPVDHPLLDTGKVRGLWNRHLAGGVDESVKLWSILMLSRFIK